MTFHRACIKSFVAAICVGVGFSGPLLAQDRVSQLLADLAVAGPETAPFIEGQITTLWSKTGSPAMDMLYMRGSDAMEAEAFDLAVGHLTALLDHAPDFAQGYVARANAYYGLGLVGPAVADLETALHLEPRHFDALTGIAAILQELGQTDKARRAWEEVLKLHPQSEAAKRSLELLDADTGVQDA